MNENTLAQIIDEWQDSLYSFAYFRVGDEGVAEDIVQEAFIKFYNAVRKKNITNIKAWLYRTVHNACIDYIRKVERVRQVSIDDVEHLLMIPTDEPHAEYIRIETVLSTVSKEQAEVVRMHVVDDLTFVEIADILHLSGNTIKSRYRYALLKLRKKYKELDFEVEEDI